MLMMNQILGFGSNASTAYRANATAFNGSSQYMHRGASLTGASDSSQGILSLWFRCDGGDGTTQWLFRNFGGTCSFYKDTSNKINVYVANSSGTRSLSLKTSASYTSSATWHHLLASWDTNFGAGSKLKNLYIDNISDLGSSTDASLAFNVYYTDTNWGVADDAGAGQLFNGCLSEIYFAPGQYLDFSNSANRSKFRDSVTGRPISLGADGSLPTGISPIVYFNSPAASFGTNSGTGGNFTATGSPTVASTSPSD